MIMLRPGCPTGPFTTLHTGHLVLTAAPLCPVGQSLAMALRHLRAPHHRRAGAETVLTAVAADGRAQSLPGLGPALEALSARHPDPPLFPADPQTRSAHQRGLALASLLAKRIEGVCIACDPFELDLGIFRLREVTTALLPLMEPLGPDHPVSALDLALLPLLWRIAVLDARFATHLLAGHDRITRRLRALLSLPGLAAELDAQAFLGPLLRPDRCRALTEAGVDWSFALGPACAPARDEAKRPSAVTKLRKS